jgi:RimJ/RimL family protein N-acetyltransferase
MVALIPMTENEYQMYVEQSLQEYAQENVRAGRWSQAEALQQAKQELQKILPQGFHSPGHYLSMIVDEQLEKRVGVLWFALRTQAGQQQAFVYDVVIFEAFRRHGYATRAFQLLEERARQLGAISIGLHVFGHNFASREMYEKLGYVATNIQMVKKLPTEQEAQFSSTGRPQ